MSYNLNCDSYSILKVISLPTLSPSTVIPDNEKENKPFFDERTIGGILQDSNYVWKANGSQFNLFDSKLGIKISSWNFGGANLPQSSKITCVTELQRTTHKRSFLVIGLENGSRGQICVFDFIGSKVLKCIDLDHMITSVCVIDRRCHISLLAEALDAFDGVVAVGTSNGNVYLLDICQRECEEVLQNVAYTNDEINISEVEILYPLEIRSVDVDNYRGSINTRHLCLHLNAITDNVEHFVLKGPKGANRLFVNKEEVTVSAIHYCPQLGSLLVGYNFGAWQLWNFANLELVYTSPVYEENIPVSHFAVQEPCDDPRAFCYVWVVYSNVQPYQRGIPIAVLYSLNYERKSVHSGYGVLYQNLTSCSVRFQITPTINKENGTETDQIGASCLHLQVVNKSIPKHSLNTQDEVITICFIVWNSCDIRNPEECKTYLNSFDLNQWYKEQMPSTLHLNNVESFTSCVCLTDILNKYNNHNTSAILDVQIDEEGLHQFLGSQKLEEHYYPSSLAFKIMSLSDNAVTIFNNKGNQRAMMTSLEALGPHVLLRPTDTFTTAVNMGLTPLFVDIPTKVTSLNDQREFLLSTALEQQMLGWLCRCMSTWSSGACDTDGCNLNFLLKWAWQRAQTLKESADKLAVSLFDYSGLVLDENTQTVLHHCLKQLRNLSMLFKFVIRKYLGFVLNPDVVLIQSEYLEIAFVYLEVLHWFQNVGLLPECSLSNYPKTDEFNRIFAPYPVEDLLKFYIKRRNDLRKCCMEKFASKESLLFIDNLIDIECGGHHLQKQWEDDGGSGIYPPPSLQALLRTYVVENVDISFKHHVVAYFLLDLVMALKDNRYQPTITHLIKFPSVFHLNPSSIKIIHSFWQLDHGNFEEGITQLLDPMIATNDLKVWHHRLVLRALLAQEQYNFALLYLQARRPAVTDINDLCTIISLYIANNMIDEAFHFQRQHHNTDVSLKLLQHFYRECDKIGNIESILFLPLWPEEEEAFMKYLTDVNHSQYNYIQILYYTQRSRYIDAMKVNDSTNIIQFQNKGLNGKQLITVKDRIMNHLECISNPLSKTIIDEWKKIELNTGKETSNSTPFSVFVHNSEERVKYKSLIEAALVKSKEIWNNPTLNQKGTKSNANIEDIPFLSKLKAVLPQPKVLSPMIYPKLRDVYSEDEGEPPAKKFKLSSRLNIPLQDTSKRHSETLYNKLSVTLSTPIVKRKLQRASTSTQETPQSILKNQICTLPTLSETVVEESSDTPAATTDEIMRHSSLRLTPRRPLTRSSKSEVRFSLTRRTSNSSEISTSSEEECRIIEETAIVHSTLHGSDETTTSKIVNIDNVPKKLTTISDSRKRSYDEITNVESTHAPDSLKTPRSRRSYKEQVADSVRSSPRLSRTKELFKDVEAKLNESSAEEAEMNSVEEEIHAEDTSKNIPVPQSTRTLRSRRSYKEPLPKSSSRKTKTVRNNLKESRTSLCREVLENNTFNKMVESTISTTSAIEQESSINAVNVFSSKTNEERATSNIPESSAVSQYDEINEFEEMEVSDIENDGLVVTEVDVHASDDLKDYLDNIVETDRNLVSKNDSVDNRNEHDIKKDGCETEKCKQVSVEEVEILEVTSTVEPDTYTDQNDFNIYDDLHDEIYKSADPDMNVFDTPSEVNEAVCASDNVAVVDLDQSDVFTVSVGENYSEEPVSSSQVVLDDTVLETVPTEIQGECEYESKHSSPVSHNEVIVISSDSSIEIRKIESDSSMDENTYSSKNNSSADNVTTLSEDSKSAHSSQSNMGNSDASLNSNEDELNSSSDIIEENFRDNVSEVSDVEILVTKSKLDESDEIDDRKCTDTTELTEVITKCDSTVSSIKLNIDQSQALLIEHESDADPCSVSQEIQDSIASITDVNAVCENSESANSAVIVRDKQTNASDTLSTTTNIVDTNMNQDRNIISSESPKASPSKLDGSNASEANETYVSDILDKTVKNPNLEYVDKSSFWATPAASSFIDKGERDSDIVGNLVQSNQYEVSENTSIVFDDIFSPLTEKQSTPVIRAKRPPSLQFFDTPEEMDIRKFALTRNISMSEPNVSSEFLTCDTPVEDKRRIIPARRKRSSSYNTLPTIPITTISNDSLACSSTMPETSTEEQTVPARRKRSSSFSTLNTSSVKRQLRARSVDVEIPLTEKTKSTGSTKSRTSKNSDKLNLKSNGRIKKSNSTSTVEQTNVEDYSSSRRLTRRQAKMLEKIIGEKTDLTRSEVKDTKSKEYMDSTNSDGESSQESKILDSSISFRLRSKSSLSDTSDIHSNFRKQRPNESSTSLSVISEEIGSSATDTKIVPRKLRKTRLNSKDSDSSVISEAHSEMEIKKPGKITRRSRSVTDEIERPNLRRSKRNIQNSTLPKIAEEPSIEGSSKTKKQRSKK
ncbi:hypothetical protein RI129_005145 [Pyrocoelia pectoralis]|uniref:Protein ELYS n=1 Tax=Pyrocoelia pectoralis TaxID=417401 RepID=A0AAN7VKE9_9COLE